LVHASLQSIARNTAYPKSVKKTPKSGLFCAKTVGKRAKSMKNGGIHSPIFRYYLKLKLFFLRILPGIEGRKSRPSKEFYCFFFALRVFLSARMRNKGSRAERHCLRLDRDCGWPA
jgi:hypothetical protein